eukprot:gene868-500_t
MLEPISKVCVSLYLFVFVFVAWEMYRTGATIYNMEQNREDHPCDFFFFLHDDEEAPRTEGLPSTLIRLARTFFFVWRGRWPHREKQRELGLRFILLLPASEGLWDHHERIQQETQHKENANSNNNNNKKHYYCSIFAPVARLALLPFLLRHKIYGLVCVLELAGPSLQRSPPPTSPSPSRLILRLSGRRPLFYSILYLEKFRLLLRLLFFSPRVLNTFSCLFLSCVVVLKCEGTATKTTAAEEEETQQATQRREEKRKKKKKNFAHTSDYTLSLYVKCNYNIRRSHSPRSLKAYKYLSQTPGSNTSSLSPSSYPPLERERESPQILNKQTNKQLICNRAVVFGRGGGQLPTDEAALPARSGETGSPATSPLQAPGPAPAPASSSSSLLTSSPFAAYPLLGPGEAKQPNGSCILYRDEVCLLVNDAYPKSTVHCLLLPLDISLASLNDLTYDAKADAANSSSSGFPPPAPSPAPPAAINTTTAVRRWARPRNHVELVEHMCRVADAYVQFLKRHSPKDYAKRRFITGFHALPSLPQLHMHLLSMDLASPCLKHKKHYNSFATYFFLTSERVVDDLRQNGRVTLNQKVAELQRMEEQPMKCLWCGTGLKDIPTMKKHVPKEDEVERRYVRSRGFHTASPSADTQLTTTGREECVGLDQKEYKITKTNKQQQQKEGAT